MESFYLILLMSLCLSVGAKSLNGTTSRRLTEKEMMEQKCMKNSGGTLTAAELYDSMRDVRNTFQNQTRNSTGDIMGDIKLFCSPSFQSTIYNGLESFTQKLSRCLDEEEAFIGDFILKTYTYGVEDICSEDGSLKLIDLITTFRDNRCKIQTLHETGFKCIERTSIFNQVMVSRSPITVKAMDVCKDLQLLKECGHEPIISECLTNLPDLVDMLLHPYLRWCGEQELH